VDRLKEKGLLGGNGYTLLEVQKIVKENMTIGRYRYKFQSIIDQPNRLEVERYYNDNISRYQRKAGVKVRMIRIDRYVTNKLTGVQTINEKALDKIEELRTNIEDYGASFAELAKANSDDVESRARGGLILLNPQDPNCDPFIDLESFKNTQLVSAIKNLQPGKTSKVFEYVWGNETQRSWAIAQVEERREAGAAPLDGKRYEEIFNELQRQKSTKKEDEWFHKAIKNSMIEEVVTDFFFPNEAQTSSAAKKDESTPKKDEKK
jgi:parvulin-like peptidyl-prolyl isomerase